LDHGVDPGGYALSANVLVDHEKPAGGLKQSGNLVGHDVLFALFDRAGGDSRVRIDEKVSVVLDLFEVLAALEEWHRMSEDLIAPNLEQTCQESEVGLVPIPQIGRHRFHRQTSGDA
jgi:hypothetical protein